MFKQVPRTWTKEDAERSRRNHEAIMLLPSIPAMVLLVLHYLWNKREQTPPPSLRQVTHALPRSFEQADDDNVLRYTRTNVVNAIAFARDKDLIHVEGFSSRLSLTDWGETVYCNHCYKPYVVNHVQACILTSLKELGNVAERNHILTEDHGNGTHFNNALSNLKDLEEMGCLDVDNLEPNNTRNPYTQVTITPQGLFALLDFQHHTGLKDIPKILWDEYQTEQRLHASRLPH